MIGEDKMATEQDICDTDIDDIILGWGEECKPESSDGYSVSEGGKPFNKPLYNQCDPMGKLLVKEIREQEGWRPKDEHIELYKRGDTIFEKQRKNGSVVKIIAESEVKRTKRCVWTTDVFPFPTVNFLGRKAKSPSHRFYIFNKERDRCVMIRRKDLQNAKPKLLNTTCEDSMQKTKDEGFLDIKCSEVRQYKKIGGKWIRSKLKGDTWTDPLLS